MASFAKVVKSGSIANTRKFTRPNCLSFKNPHGTTRAQIWKMLEDLGFNSSQVIGLVEKKANYMDLTCKNRETVVRVYKKLTEVRDISNLRLYESDKVYVAVHWVPVPFPVDALSSYLEKHHGAISRHVNKVDQKGFQMGIHMFEMRKDQITENPIGSYIYVLGCEFLVKYAGQEATCHLCGKTGHKSAECEEKEERKQWPKLQKNKPGKTPIIDNQKSNETTISHVQQDTPYALQSENNSTQSNERENPNKDWFELVEEDMTCKSAHERVTEARKRHRSEAESQENSDCDNTGTKIIKTYLELQCSFCNKIGQCDPNKKHFTCTNCKCEQEINDVCCEGKLKLIPSGFHSHRCLDCGTLLERCDNCERYVKISSISGILNKCASCDSVLAKCDCDVLNVLPEASKKLKCRNSLCKIQIINCNCGKVVNQDFQNISFWDCECGMKFLKNDENGTLEYTK